MCLVLFTVAGGGGAATPRARGSKMFTGELGYGSTRRASQQTAATG